MTIGVIPGMVNDSVEVSGGTGFRAAGRREVLTTPVGGSALISERPTPPAMTAPPRVPALAIRNRRRVHSWLVEVAAAWADPDSGDRPEVRREPAAADRTTSARRAAVLSVGRQTGRSTGPSAGGSARRRAATDDPGTRVRRPHSVAKPAETASSGTMI